MTYSTTFSRTDADDTQPRRQSHEFCQAVAHDLNNLFTCILGYSDVLATEGSLLHRDHAERAIRVAVGRATALTSTLLTPDRAVAATSVPVGRLVAESVNEMRELAGPETRLDLVVDAPAARVFGHRLDVEVIVSNLVMNALEAVRAPGGCVSVRVTEESGGDEPLVRISVSDDGPGIDEGDLARLFEKGFTTRARGTGMGLALVRSSVEALAGTIAVESTSEGTRFDVDLPVSAESSS